MANWCAEGAAQSYCYRNHVWKKLPQGPGRGKDRECPACGANLTISLGERGAWIVWFCHGGCDRRVIRLALEQTAGIPGRCLGSYASEDWERRQQRDGQGRGVPCDPATLAAARRSYAYQKLISADVPNLSVLRMCMQAISESDGNLPADPDHLLPRDYKAFVSLAKRTGIERCYAAKLARSWLTR